jgi:hypothetical protein
MKTTVKLNENDIRAILAERYGCDQKAIRMRYTATEQDGPHYSPASMTAEIDVDEQPAVIAQQTVVMGGAVFGPTTIVMPGRR